MRPQPMISVHGVEASSRWYQHLLGCTSDPDGYTVVLASPDGTADGTWHPE